MSNDNETPGNSKPQTNQQIEVNDMRVVLNWVLQILLWICQIFMTSYFISFDYSVFWIVVSTIIYITYITLNIIECPSYQYMQNFIRLGNLEKYMKILFVSLVEVSFHIENYHYKRVIRKNRTETKKVVTSSTSIKYDYKSCRDLSGLININYDGKRDYLRLKLNWRMTFDSDTERDYEHQKNIFKSSQHGKDDHMDFWETKELKNYREHILILLHDRPNYFFNPTSYYLILLLGFIEPFKMYFNSKGIYDEVDLVKEISYNKDLNTKEYTEKYKDLMPKLSIKKINNNEIFINTHESEIKQPLIPK